MSSAAPPVAKPDEPKSLLEKVGPAVAIGLTALAAVFGSMSAAALQQAMYWKSQAAQDQSKSTNQWSLSGFKVDRALIVQTSAATLRTLSGYAKGSFDVNAADPVESEARDWLLGKGPPAAYRRADKPEEKQPPKVGLPDIADAELTALLDAIKNREPEDAVLAKAARVPLESINHAIDAAETHGEKITEKDWDPIVKAARRIVSGSMKATIEKAADPAAGGRVAGATQAALLEMDQRRYRSEATLNQEIGYLYEARVKVSGATSDRYRKKSELLGYAMLVAQIGAVAASLALARKQGFSLWLVAGGIGILAVGFGSYAVVPASLVPF